MNGDVLDYTIRENNWENPSIMIETWSIRDDLYMMIKASHIKVRVRTSRRKHEIKKLTTKEAGQINSWFNHWEIDENEIERLREIIQNHLIELWIQVAWKRAIEF